MTKNEQKSETPKEKAFEGERIAKRLARAGIASRREVERMIEAGRVKVDGKKILSPALNVTDKNIITVDGKPVNAADETRVWRYHKTDGTLTTNRDPEGRPTIFEKLPPELPRVVAVGRLDFNTEGLILLTNDGELARHLELPSNAWIRHYRVRVHGYLDDARLAELEKGPLVEGIQYAPVKVERESTKKEGSNSWLYISISEGKNREIRKIMESIGLQVTRLIRVSYGPFPLGKLPRGGIEEIPNRVLRSQLGAFFNSKKA